MLRHGVGLEEIVRHNASRGAYGPGDSEDFVTERVASLLYEDQPTRLRLFSTRRVIEMRSARLPDGGIVTTYTDVTKTVQAEEALEAANELLERRVDERTAELKRLNAELARAKNEADEANLSKTRFLAAASHDILQPLNAARLYASALAEGAQPDRAPRSGPDLARNVDVSLEAVEEILGALLDMSRLDAGATRPEISDVPVADLMRMLEIEFARVARAKGLDLRFVADEPRGAHRPPADAPPAAEPRLQRAQIYAQRPRAGRLPPGGRGGAHRSLGHRPRHSARPAAGGVRGVPAARSGRAGRARPRPRAFDRRAARAGARPSGRSEVAAGKGLGVLGDRADRPRRGGRAAEAGAPRRAAAGEPLSGLKILVIDNEPRVLEGMRALLERWGCRVATAHGLDEARAALATFGAPDVIIADYHLDYGRRDRADPRAAARISAATSPPSSPPPTAAPRCATWRRART